MLIVLYIRFPYLNSYIDIDEREGNTHPMKSLLALPKDDILEDQLCRMALACVAPTDSTMNVVRLVDHLGERTKYAEENPRPQSSGPLYLFLPDASMIRKYCK